MKKTLGSRIRGATQNYFKQLGTITLRLSYGGNVVKDTITIVDGHLVVPVLVRWNSTASLRNDLTYPACLNQVKCSTGIEEYSCGENPKKVVKFQNGENPQNGKNYQNGEKPQIGIEEYLYGKNHQNGEKPQNGMEI